MRSKLLFISFLTFSSILFAQRRELNCLDFSKGEFRNISENNNNLSSIIIRNGEKQLEITNGVESYKRIQWMNDCDYILTFSKKEAKKDKFKKFINESGGITVKVEKIEDNTLYYKTSYFDGKRDVVGEGRMIRISGNASF